jgi:PAS domain S-box-containing protein
VARGRDYDDAPEEGEGRGSVIFLFIVLIALGAIPVASTMLLSGLESDVEEVLDPLRSTANDLARIHARQMQYFQEYLITGDILAAGRYQELLEDDAEVSQELRAEVERLDAAASENVLEDVELHFPVLQASSDWQIGHTQAFGIGPGEYSDSARLAFVESGAYEASQAQFETLLEAHEALQAELDARIAAGRRRVSTGRDFVLLTTVGLVGLALLGTAVVGRLARRLRFLVRDIRTRHRDTLRVRRELDAVFDATADAIVEVGADGRIARINPAATRMLGWGEEAARGEPVEHILLGRHDADASSPVVEAARAGIEVDGEEASVRTRRGDPVPVLWSTRLTDDSEARRVVVTLTDLTDIRAATEALRAAVRAREETLAVVSHDLRSPLSTVQAVGELLIDVPLEEDRRAAQLRNLMRATERMDRLIRDLLDVARIDAGGLSVAVAPTSAVHVVEEALGALLPRAEAAGISLVATRVPGVDVLVDVDRIQQVWENLVSNALRHTDSEGRIELGAELLPDRVRFRVVDTGSGIAEDQLPHLFDRFWRAEGGRRDGAGLGLAIVRGVVEAHGGEVGARSRPGEGATFTFTLRRAPADLASAAAPTPGSS